MTTIPIEVIVQDAEAPVVPSEDGTTNTNTNTETAANVAVPDTGSGIGNIFTGSASSIILPAMLLVIAVGSIVAMLIHKYHKQKNNKTTRKEKLAVATSSVIAVLAATVLVSNLILPATKAATSDIGDGIVPAEDKVSIVVTRNGGSAEASIESTATITSSSDFGYKVLLSMAENVDSANLYLDGNVDSEYFIAPVEAGESTELGDNTWGYALTEDGEYSAIPLLDDAATVAQGSEPVEDETLSIYYGVKVSSDLPAGTYSGGEIEYMLEAIEPTLPISYMQDFAILPAEEKTSLINSMPEGYQFTLKDNRDQKDYYISKLADGNVWMTQNLDLDLSTNTELTPANTNISSAWTPANSTIAFTDTTVYGWQNNDNVPYSADPGELYIYSSGTTKDDDQYTTLANCQAAHSDCSMHNHVGNYYSWSAAVASNDTSEFTTQYTNMEDSICPAGWELPTGRQNGNDPLEDNELGTLVNSYGILGASGGCGGTCVYYNYADGGFNAIRTAPLWLARSGYVNDGSLDSTGSLGSYLSSTVYSNDGTYHLYFYSGDVLPAYGGRRDGGYSVRCIAR